MSECECFRTARFRGEQGQSCHLRDDLRSFSIDAIAQLHVVQESGLIGPDGFVIKPKNWGTW